MRSVSARTRFADALGLRTPLMCAVMDGVSGGALAAAAARAGALGSIACAGMTDPERIKREVQIFRVESPAGSPLCLGFLEDKCLQHGNGDFAPILDAIGEHEPQFVQLYAPASDSLIAQIRRAFPRPMVLAQIGSVADAKRVIGAGVHGVIAVGREAGGHGLPSKDANGTLPLARRVVQLAAESGRRPAPLVLAAGGIVDGAGVASALALGCDGAVLGTRLWATHQALGSQARKQQLPLAECDDVIKTEVYDAINNKIAEAEGEPLWRAPWNNNGCLKNETIEKYHGKEAELAEFLAGLSVEECKAEKARGYTLSGEGVGSISSLRDAEEVLVEINEELVAQIKRSYALLS